MIIAQTPPDTKITVKLIRDGKPQTKDVTLGKLQEENIGDGELVPGVSVAPISAEARKEFRIDDRVEGLLITEVAADSPYREIFPANAVLVSINRVPVSDLASAKRLLRERNLALVYYRGVFRYLTFIVQ
jgi:S1-C subfamily serine protease